MSRKPTRGGPRAPQGPSQRQLRAAELVRHALIEILREEEFHDEALRGVSVTVSEVRLSPDFRHALCFVEPLGAHMSGAVANPEAVVDALNKVSRFLRGVLGRKIDMRQTPALKFLRDDSFDEAERIGRLLLRPDIARDLQAHEDEDGPETDDDAEPSA